MEQLNKIADKLVWEMFTDSGGSAETGQAYIEDEYDVVMDPLVRTINIVTSDPDFTELWEKGIVGAEFAITPFVDFLEGNLPLLTERQLHLTRELSKILDVIFEPY